MSGLYILINGVDQSAHYKGASLRINEKTGSDRSTFSFTLENPLVTPLNEQEVVIWDSVLMRRKECRGSIQRSPRKPIGRKEDGSTAFSYEITVGAVSEELNKIPPITTDYQDRTTGFMFRDVLTNAPGFDFTGISLGGLNQKFVSFRHLILSQALDRIAGYEGYQWYVDYDRKVYFGDPNDQPVILSVNDDNWDTYFGMDFTVDQDTSTLANQIRLFYDSKYAGGTVSVFTGSNEIAGVGTEWEKQITPGARFRLTDEHEVVYTVQRVVNDNLIELSSDYAGGTELDVTYVIEGVPRSTQKQDPLAVSFLQALVGGSGVRHRNEDFKGGYLTIEEAITLIEGILQKDAYPKVGITAKSRSTLLGIVPQAGECVHFNLTDWDILDTVLQIRSVDKSHVGAYDEFGYPVYEVTLKIQERLYDLMGDLRRRVAEADQTNPRETNLIDQIFTPSDVVLVGEVTTTTIEDEPYWPPFVCGVSTFAWDSQSEWLTWSLSNLTATVGGLLQFTGAQLIGSATSPWLIQYSANQLKARTLTASIPGGCTATTEWQGMDFGGVLTAWVSNIALLPDAKYMRARISLTRTTGAEALTVDKLSFTPYKTTLRWGRSTWMRSKDLTDTAAQWAEWTLTNMVVVPPLDAPFMTDTADTILTDGGLTLGFFSEGDSIILAPGATSGSAVSPWRINKTRTVIKETSTTAAIPVGTSATVTGQTSIDATAANASALYTIPDTPDAGYIRYDIAVTQPIGMDEVEFKRIEVSPK